MPDLIRLDPIAKEFIFSEMANDNVVVPYSNTRRVARKLYRILKAMFLGVPIMNMVICDLMSEVAVAGTKEMTRRVTWRPLIAFLPPPVIAGGLALYKVTKKDSIRRAAAFVTNAVGLIYTFPCYVFDHSMLYFFEQAAFGAPVPIMPQGRLRIISNETSTDIMRNASYLAEKKVNIRLADFGLGD